MNAPLRQRLAWALALGTGIILALVLLYPRLKPSEHARRAASQSAQGLLDDDSTPDVPAATDVIDLNLVTDSAEGTTRPAEHVAAAHGAADANPIPVGHCKIPDADDPPSPIS